MTARESEGSLREATVGILGGMGPAATVDLMRRVIEGTPARDDGDHLRMLVDNNPKVPSRIAALIEKTGPSPAPALIAMARGLRDQGADFLVMPCNTAHYYHRDIANAVDIPVLNLMELVAAHIAEVEANARRIGLLASSALSKIALYEPYFQRRGVEVIYPDATKQDALMELIRALKAEGGALTEKSAFVCAARQLLQADADCLLIACTELSFIADELRIDAPIYDAAEVLAQAVVQRSRRDTL